VDYPPRRIALLRALDREEFEAYNQGEDITRTGIKIITPARQLTLFEQSTTGLARKGFQLRYTT